MKVVDGIFARARQVGRFVGEGIADSGKAAVYLRQLLRGNRAAPSVLRVPRLQVARPLSRAIPPVGPAVDGALPARSGAARPAERTRVGSARRAVATGPDDAEAPLAAAPPVLLLHGYLATRGSVHLLEERLTALGHVVMTYRFGPVHLGSISDSAGFIARKIESLVAQTGVEQVDVVAHSMGGLVALDYLKRLDGHRRVRRMILLGTPIRGTWAAVLGLATAPLGRASRQLLPGSEFLRELERRPLPVGPEVIAVAGDRDWLAPPRTTMAPGIRHMALPTGHTGLLVDETVAQTISDLLAAPARPRP